MRYAEEYVKNDWPAFVPLPECKICKKKVGLQGQQTAYWYDGWLCPLHMKRKDPEWKDYVDNPPIDE